MSGLYFKKQSDYSEENTCGNKVFYDTILQPFLVRAWIEKSVVMRAIRKKLNIFRL